MNYATKTVIAGCCILSPVGVAAASADPTTLVCEIHTDMWASDEPTTIDLNEAQGTVTVHIGAYHMPGHGGGSYAHNFAPVPATFSEDQIAFRDPGTDRDDTINRVSGSWVESGIRTWVCQAGHKQF